MRGQVKRDINDAVRQAVASALEGVGFKRQRQGYWIAPKGQVRWELEVVFEQEHGDGYFRLEWGVRVPGVTKILEQEEIDEAAASTVGGDVGSLALRRSQMTFLLLTSGKAGWLRRLLFDEVRFHSPDEITRVLVEWFTGPLLSTLRPLTTYAAVANFLENAENILGPWFDYPETQLDRDKSAAVVWALIGNRTAALAALQRARAAVPRTKSEELNRDRQAYYDRVAERIVEMTKTAPDSSAG